MTYATKAVIQHEFDTDHLNIWLTFSQPMDIRFKPNLEVWIAMLDNVQTAIDSSNWIDEFTLLLIIENVAFLPNRVTVAFDGPSNLLTTTWGKQWEAWGAILSFTGWPQNFKTNMIILWYGSIVSIPSGWHICDGTDGTPTISDLQTDVRYIMKL